MNTSAVETSYRGPKSEQIRSMFSGIADRYDLANTVLSGGVHHRWRKQLVRWSGATPGDRVLDCATGTGDLAIEFKRAVGPTGEVTGTDFCAEMLAPAPQKAATRQLEIKFEQADVTALPYADNSFDVSSIAFGIRNVEDPTKGLQELARVTRSGGQVMVLEFGQPVTPIFREAFMFYSERILPKIGGWLTGCGSAYSYLQTSSQKFPARGAFVDMMMQTNCFSKVEFRSATFGIAYLYKGTVR